MRAAAFIFLLSGIACLARALYVYSVGANGAGLAITSLLAVALIYQAFTLWMARGLAAWTGLLTGLTLTFASVYLALTLLGLGVPTSASAGPRALVPDLWVLAMLAVAFAVASIALARGLWKSHAR